KGHHACIQYSNLGLTNALYSLTMTSLLLKRILRFIIPSTGFAFLTAIIHCSVDLPLLSIITPKSLSCLDFFKILFPILYSHCEFLLPKCITVHLSKLNSICQSTDH